jgi:hypothetical protein
VEGACARDTATTGDAVAAAAVGLPWLLLLLLLLLVLLRDSPHTHVLVLRCTGQQQPAVCNSTNGKAKAVSRQCALAQGEWLCYGRCSPGNRCRDAQYSPPPSI